MKTSISLLLMLRKSFMSSSLDDCPGRLLLYLELGPISVTKLSLFWGLNPTQSDSWPTISLLVKSAPGISSDQKWLLTLVSPLPENMPEYGLNDSWWWCFFLGYNTTERPRSTFSSETQLLILHILHKSASYVPL